MTKMKKILAVGLASILAVSFAACSKTTNDDNTTDGGSKADTVKTGLAVISEIKADEYNPSDTALEIDSVAAAVTVDADGKIVDVKIDEAQTKPDLTKDNGNVTDLRTKLAKKEDYGMKSVSAANGIGKEWYEQVAAFETWAKGKTADEVKAGVDAEGNPTDADLKAGCTIKANGFTEVVAKAMASATDMGAKATDTLRLSVTTEKYYESNETNLQYDSNYAAVTFDAEGKITSCLIDASQAKCSIADGKFTVEKGAYQSKKELKENYNMKAVSAANGIGKEWYEQAAAFETWAKGKTAAEIKASVGEDGKPTDADLKAGCTIVVSSIVETVAAAATV